MKPYSLLLCAALALLGVTSFARAVPVAGTRVVARQEVLIMPRPGVNVARVAQDYRATILARTPGSWGVRLRLPAGTNLSTVMRSMGRDPRLLSTEANSFQSSTEQSIQWTTAFDGGNGPVYYEGQPGVPQVHYDAAPGITKGAGVLVAVLDTGISLRHPDLQGRTVPGWNFVDDNANTDDAPAGLDSNRNGKKDEAVGHGSVVAGIVARLAPEATLLPVKVLDSDGYGNIWTLIEGVNYAVKRGAKIINLSLATQTNSSLFAHALQDAWDAGVLIVTSAGNTNTDRPQFPAAFSFVLSVAGLDTNDAKAPFSNWGSVVDVSAPGVDVVSTFWDGRYVKWSGTSFAAAFVSGEAALVRSVAPNLRVDRVARLIADQARSVDRANPRYRGKLGRKGIIDVDAAVRAAQAG